MRNNRLVIDTTHDIIHFQRLTMKFNTASSETTAKPQSVLSDDALTLPPRTTKTTKVFVDDPSE